jgi:hypothetical protein
MKPMMVRPEAVLLDHRAIMCILCMTATRGEQKISAWFLVHKARLLNTLRFKHVQSMQVQQILDEQRKRALEMIQQYQSQVEALSHELLEKQV